jgi:hypothetical protein
MTVEKAKSILNELKNNQRQGPNRLHFRKKEK